MRTHVGEPPAKPLPVIVKTIVDELLSSWLRRTGQIYGVSARDVLRHFGVTPPEALRLMDFAQPLEIKARLAWCLRTNVTRIRRASHPVSIKRSIGHIAIEAPFFNCLTCARKRQTNVPCHPVSRSWYESWRIACGFCGRPFHLGPRPSNHAMELPPVPDNLWQDAVAGSKIFECYLGGEPCGWLPPRLIWALASIPISSRSGARTGFGLIILEACHAAYGGLHQSPASTVRTKNAYRRLGLLAVLHRFNQNPARWIQAFSDAATEAGKAAISALLDDLPDAVGDALHEETAAHTTLRRGLLYACQAAELHQLRLKIAANLRQIDEFCLKLTSAAPQ